LVDKLAAEPGRSLAVAASVAEGIMQDTEDSYELAADMLRLVTPSVV
jgi:hypothetical protein